MGVLVMKLGMETNSEFLIEIFKNQVPKDNYQTSVNLTDVDFGEKIHLTGKNNELFIYWKVQFEVSCISRQLDFHKLLKYGEISNFQNIIYEVKNSELVKDFEYRGFEDVGSSNLIHYLIISENLIVNVLALDDIRIHFKKLDGKNLEKEIIIFNKNS